MKKDSTCAKTAQVQIHLKNVFSERELDENSVIEESSVVQNKSQISRDVVDCGRMLVSPA